MYGMYFLFQFLLNKCEMPMSKKNDWGPYFHRGGSDACLQVYISWALRQRSRSCKVLMIMNYTLPDTEFITLNSQPQYGSTNTLSPF